MSVDKKKLPIYLDEMEILFKERDIFKIDVVNINTSNTERANYIYTNEDGEYEKYTYIKFCIAGYDDGFLFQYTYEGETVNAFSVLFWKKKGSVTTENKITFYGSFLHEKGRTYILELIEDFFKTENFLGLRRFDVACDVPESKKNIIQSFKRKPKTELNYDAKKQEHETYYFWNRQNRTRLIRVYDKVLDTFKKWKWHLYNFTEHDNVTRIEVEFWKTAIDAMNENETYVSYDILLRSDLVLKNLFLQSVINSIWYFEEVDFNKYEFSYPRRHKKDLKEYYMKHKQLPEWYRKNGFWLFQKIRKAIGFKWFFEYLFEDIELEKWLDKFMDFYYKKKWAEKRVRIANMSSWKMIKSIYDREQLAEDIFEMLYKQKSVSSDVVCSELQKTIRKLKGEKI